MLTTSSAKAQAPTISGYLPVICGVYCITHTATGRRYVGQSIDCIRRMLDHGRYNDYPIGNAVRLYGRGAFHFEILSVVPRHQLLTYEAGWIEILETEHPHGFNQKRAIPESSLTPRQLYRRRVKAAYRQRKAAAAAEGAIA